MLNENKDKLSLPFQVNETPIDTKCVNARTNKHVFPCGMNKYTHVPCCTNTRVFLC